MVSQATLEATRNKDRCDRRETIAREILLVLMNRMGPEAAVYAPRNAVSIADDFIAELDKPKHE